MPSTEGFDASAFLVVAVLGGLLGMVGQGVRAIIGLKKARDEAAMAGKDFAEVFRPGELALSLVIGFVAGVLGLLTLNLGDTGTKITMQQIVTLLTIGYAGTDFIEGFMQRSMPGIDAKATALAGSAAMPQEAPTAPNPAHG